MLVLSRRPNQVIHIRTSDGLIEVHLNDCNSSQARLGFVAPANVKIMREEKDEPDEAAGYPSKPENLVQSQRTPPFLVASIYNSRVNRAPVSRMMANHLFKLLNLNS